MDPHAITRAELPVMQGRIMARARRKWCENLPTMAQWYGFKCQAQYPGTDPHNWAPTIAELTARSILH